MNYRGRYEHLDGGKLLSDDLKSIASARRKSPSQYRMGLFCHRKYVLFCMKSTRYSRTGADALPLNFTMDLSFCFYLLSARKTQWRKFAHFATGLPRAYDGFPNVRLKWSQILKSVANLRLISKFCDGYWLFAIDLKFREIGPCYLSASCFIKKNCNHLFVQWKA